MLFTEVSSETTSLEVFSISFAYRKEISSFIFYGRNFFPQQMISADVVSEFSETTFLAGKHIGGRVITLRSSALREIEDFEERGATTEQTSFLNKVRK